MNMSKAAKYTASMFGCPHRECTQAVLCSQSCPLVKHPVKKSDDEGWDSSADHTEVTENTGPALSDATVRLANLVEGVKKLREVWFTGGDLNKDAIATECLNLFKLLPAK